ncbi:metallophosphoesterase, partial [Candidatus Woesearchaeota archaeon]|nr:metallophosphoesterase [Candidatus Woesearchaeota archaeon]
MRILAAGDIHGDRSLAQRLAEKAVKENADLVIITGDITHFDQSADGIMGPFVAKKKKVLFVPGNHDSFATADFLVSMYGVKNIHGYSVRYEDIGIFGCGGANVGPVTTLQEKEIETLLQKGFDKIKYLPKKIMVTHVHPSETAMEKFSTFIPGSSGVKRALEAMQPDFLLCSHVHEAEGIEEMVGVTKVINVGKEGTILD